jgi:hypothetical protein
MGSFASVENSAYSLNIQPKPSTTNDNKRSVYSDDMVDVVVSDVSGDVVGR